MTNDQVTFHTNWKKIRAISYARAFSILGSELTLYTLILREKESGAATVSILFVLGTLPFVLFAPWAGMLADRYSTKQVVFISSILQAALIFSLTLDGAHLLVFSTLFLANSLGSVANPSWGALIPTLATKDDLPRALGFSQTAFAFAGFFAPALAGFLVSTSGFYWPFVIDAISFLFIATMPFVLKVNRPGTVTVNGEKNRAMDGLNHLFREPLLRALLILLTTFILALGVVNVGEVFLVTQVLGASAFIYGVVGSSFALGMLLGAAGTATYKAPARKHAQLVVIGLGLLSVAVLGIALAWHWLVVLLFSFLAGLGNSMLNSYATAIFMNNSDPVMQGRIIAGVGGVINVGLLTSMGLAGVLIGVFGVREVLFAGGLLSALVLVILAPAVLRQAPRDA